jgi:uncharacterized protein (DUF1697 family)
MTRYLALLRGVNLGAKNKVPMGDLRGLIDELGYKEVRTYLQSGNVVFQSSSSSRKKIAAQIVKAISVRFGLNVAVIMRTYPELKRVAAGNPFSSQAAKSTSLQVMFLADVASSRAVKALDPDRSAPDRFEVKGREVYLWLPKGSARSKLTITYFEKVLGTQATARNWNTVTKLLDLMDG